MLDFNADGIPAAPDLPDIPGAPPMPPEMPTLPISSSSSSSSNQTGLNAVQNEAIAALKKRVKSLQSEIDIARNNGKSTQQLEQEYATLKKTHWDNWDTVQRELNKRENAIESLENRILGKIRGYQDDLEKANKELETIEKELKNFQQFQSSDPDKMKKALLKMGSLNSKITDKKREIAKIEAILAGELQLDTELDKLKNDLSNLKKTLDAYRKENAHLKVYKNAVPLLKIKKANKETPKNENLSLNDLTLDDDTLKLWLDNDLFDLMDKENLIEFYQLPDQELDFQKVMEGYSRRTANGPWESITRNDILAIACGYRTRGEKGVCLGINRLLKGSVLDSARKEKYEALVKRANNLKSEIASRETKEREAKREVAIVQVSSPLIIKVEEYSPVSTRSASTSVTTMSSDRSELSSDDEMIEISTTRSKEVAAILQRLKTAENVYFYNTISQKIASAKTDEDFNKIIHDFFISKIQQQMAVLSLTDKDSPIACVTPFSIWSEIVEDKDAPHLKKLRQVYRLNYDAFDAFTQENSHIQRVMTDLMCEVNISTLSSEDLREITQSFTAQLDQMIQMEKSLELINKLKENYTKHISSSIENTKRLNQYQMQWEGPLETRRHHSLTSKNTMQLVRNQLNLLNKELKAREKQKRKAKIK